MAGFKVGDTVRLKSGGPLMTVTEVQDAEVWTIWFDKSDKEQKGYYANSDALIADSGGPVIA